MSDGCARACSSSHPSECRLRLVTIGNSGVGKSSLLSKYTDNTFDITLMNTCGIDFKTKILKVEGKTVKLHIWDTAGQERFWSVTPAYCRNANGIILMYDITDMQSFEAIRFWVDKLLAYAPTDVETILLASKLDLEGQRVVSERMGVEAAKTIKASFFEVSALTGKNIENAMEVFVTTILKKQGFFGVRTLLPSDDVETGKVISVEEKKRTRKNSLSTCCNQSVSTHN